MRAREKLRVKRRILRNLLLLALSLALLFGFTGASPTPGLALRRTLAGAHFGPYEIEAAFSLPDLDCYRQDTHYYLARCRDWYYLSAVEKVYGFLWREEHPIFYGPAAGPMSCTLIDYADHTQCRQPRVTPTYRYLEIVALGTTSVWLVQCADPAVARVEADELRTYDGVRSDTATVQGRSVGEGLWLLEFLRPAGEGVDYRSHPSLTLSQVRCLDAGGRVLYTQANVGGVAALSALG